MKSRLAVLIVIVATLTGCQTTGQPGGPPSAPAGQGRLVLTLNGPERSPVDLTVELSGVLLHLRGGGWVQIPAAPIVLNSVQVVGRQVPLADVSLPAGRYDRLTLKLDKATLRQ